MRRWGYSHCLFYFYNPLRTDSVCRNQILTLRRASVAAVSRQHKAENRGSCCSTGTDAQGKYLCDFTWAGHQGIYALGGCRRWEWYLLHRQPLSTEVVPCLCYSSCVPWCPGSLSHPWVSSPISQQPGAGEMAKLEGSGCVGMGRIVPLTLCLEQSWLQAALSGLTQCCKDISVCWGGGSKVVGSGRRK